MANRTYLYAAKIVEDEGQYTGIGEFNYTIPFIAHLFTFVDVQRIPSLIFNDRLSGFYGRLVPENVTTFIHHIQELFHKYKTNIAPDIVAEMDKMWTQALDRLEKISAEGYTHVLMEPAEVFALGVDGDDEFDALGDELLYDMQNFDITTDTQNRLSDLEAQLQAGKFQDPTMAWEFLRELGAGFYSSVLYFDLRRITEVPGT